LTKTKILINETLFFTKWAFSDDDVLNDNNTSKISNTLFIHKHF